MKTYEEINATAEAGLSDTLYYQRRWSPFLASGELIRSMHDALELAEQTRALAEATGARRDVMTWRFFAREVHSIAEVLRDGYGYSIVLPASVEAIPPYVERS